MYVINFLLKRLDNFDDYFVCSAASASVGTRGLDHELDALERADFSYCIA